MCWGSQDRKPSPAFFSASQSRLSTSDRESQELREVQEFREIRGSGKAQAAKLPRKFCQMQSTHEVLRGPGPAFLVPKLRVHALPVSCLCPVPCAAPALPVRWLPRQAWGAVWGQVGPVWRPGWQRAHLGSLEGRGGGAGSQRTPGRAPPEGGLFGLCGLCVGRPRVGLTGMCLSSACFHLALWILQTAARPSPERGT